MKRWATVVLPILFSWPCFAFSAPPEDVHVHARVWTEADLEAGGPNVLSAGGTLEVHGPLFLSSSNRAFFHGLAAVDITQAPQASAFDFSSPSTFGTYAGAKLALWHEIAGFHHVGAGWVYLAPEVRYRFFTSLGKTSVPDRRYLRAYGVGPRLGLLDASGDELLVLSIVYGPDERDGDFGDGQVSYDAVVTVTDATKAWTGAIGIEAVTGAFKPAGVRQTDMFSIRVIAAWGKK